MNYWKYKIFKTNQEKLDWIEKNDSKYQWQEIFVNNAYGVTYRKLIKIG